MGSNSFVQSDSDAPKTLRTASGVAKPPGAAVRYVIMYDVFRARVLNNSSGQTTSNWRHRLETQLNAGSGCRWFIEHHAQTVHR